PGADKCRLDRAAMRFPQAVRRGEKKRLHSGGAEPDDRTKVQIQCGRWTREENTPSAVWIVAEGGEFSADPVSHDPGPEGGGTGGIAIDRLYMLPPPPTGKG